MVLLPAVAGLLRWALRALSVVTGKAPLVEPGGGEGEVGGLGGGDGGLGGGGGAGGGGGSTFANVSSPRVWFWVTLSVSAEPNDGVANTVEHDWADELKAKPRQPVKLMQSVAHWLMLTGPGMLTRSSAGGA